MSKTHTAPRTDPVGWMPFLAALPTRNRAAMVSDAVNRLAELRLPAFWSYRFTTPSSLEGLLHQIAAEPADSAQAREIAAFGGFDAAAMERLRGQAVTGARYLEFFENLDYGRQRLLTGRNAGLAAFDHLRDAENFKIFAGHLEGMRTLRLPTELEEFREFLIAWPEVRASLTAARDGQRRATEALRESLDSRSMTAALAGSDGDFLRKAREAGFSSLDDATARTLSHQASLELMAGDVAARIEDPEIRRAVAVRLDILPQEVTPMVLWPVVSRRDGAEWFAGLFEEGTRDPAALRELAVQRMEAQRLSSIEPLKAEIGGGFMGMGERMTWLIVLSLVVCVVGIANAMLMSVTERYREIATFKCLGALDGSIMLIFVIEASLLGSAGGLLGALAGGLLAVLSMLVSHGTYVLGVLPPGPLFLCVLVSIAAGVHADEARARGMDILGIVGLRERWFHRPVEMSGGQQQRVAIGRSLANNPAILLCDEPTANLDINTGQEILEILQGLNKDRGVTIICATHDHRMLNICDRLMWIRDGGIERIANRDEVEIELGSIGGEE